MDDDLSRSYRRWRQADENGRDGDADAAFRAVFTAALHESPVSEEFAAKTIAAVASAATRDARRARRTRIAATWIGVCGGAVLTYFTASLIAAAVFSAFTGLLDLVIGVVVAVATGGQSGTSVWTMVTSLGRAAAAFATNPTVTFTFLAMQALAIGALVALQRLLGSDWESFK